MEWMDASGISGLVVLSFWSFVLMQVSSQEITSTLHSTEYGLNFAYDGETIGFTCIAEGKSMAWSSDEYIGSNGNRIEFVSIDPMGTQYHAGQTVATLVNVSNMNGLIILESLLQISVQSEFQTSSIQCHKLGSNTVNTISFGTSGNTSITCDKRSACPGETVRCTCITGYSNTLAWSSELLIGPNDARLEFVSIDPVNTTHRVPGSSTRAVLTDVSSPNGVVVLSSDLSFIVSDNATILTCLNVGQERSYSIIFPMSKTCLPVSTIYFPTPNATTDLLADIPGPQCHSDKLNNIPIVFCVFSSVVVVILIIVLVIRERSRELTTSSNESHQIREPVAPPVDEQLNSLEVVVERPTLQQESLNTGPGSRNILPPGPVHESSLVPEEQIETRQTKEMVKPELSQEFSLLQSAKSGIAKFSQEQIRHNVIKNVIVPSLGNNIIKALFARVGKGGKGPVQKKLQYVNKFGDSKEQAQ